MLWDKKEVGQFSPILALHCTVFERYEIKKIEHCNFIALDKNLEDYWPIEVEILNIYYYQVCFLLIQRLVFYTILAILAPTYEVKVLGAHYNQKETYAIKKSSLVQT